MTSLKSAPGTGKTLVFDKLVDAAASALEPSGMRPMLVLPEGLSAEDVVALSMIAAERARQIASGTMLVVKPGADEGDLETAAGEYLLHAGSIVRDCYPAGAPRDMWPYSAASWKPTSPILDAVRGCAFGIAGIADRLRLGERAEG